MSDNNDFKRGLQDHIKKRQEYHKIFYNRMNTYGSNEGQKGEFEIWQTKREEGGMTDKQRFEEEKHNKWLSKQVEKQKIKEIDARERQQRYNDNIKEQVELQKKWGFLSILKEKEIFPRVLSNAPPIKVEQQPYEVPPNSRVFTISSNLPEIEIKEEGELLEQSSEQILKCVQKKAFQKKK